MAPPSNRSPLTPRLARDLRGVAGLLTDATLAVTHISEGVHQSVWRTLGAPGGSEPGRTRGLTAAIYGGIRGVTRLVGSGADRALAGAQALLDAGDDDASIESPRREALLAALNGVLGDRLAASGNVLATPMSLRRQGREWKVEDLPARPSPRVLLRVHGLCMNDHQWPGAVLPGAAVDALAAALDAEALYLRYNSGRHISDNGRELCFLLERLLALWPGGLESISVVAHSMGGLVMRSALHQAMQGGMRWPLRLKQLVFLGTPHHGAPLERAGRWVELLLGSTAYSAPFVRLTQLRSAGITDLRHGLLLESDWQGTDRFERGDDTRTPVPLPAHVACFAAAASTAAQRSALAERFVGDGLVPLQSALGRHADAARSLAFPEDATRVFYGVNHMQLLHHPDVALQLRQWLAGAPD
jgi:hypothetical protein